MSVWTFVSKYKFVLLLLVGFLCVDTMVAWMDPMTHSRRFQKDDFTKTLYHHQWDRSGPVFFGNSAVTGAYIEEQSASQLVEMGMSLGKVTDLKQILQRGLYTPEEQLVLGIDVHTMLDALPTDPRFPWSRPVYSPYVFYFRDYFQDAGGEFLLQAWKGIRQGKLDLHTYEPRWIDKELYFGRKTAEQLQQDNERYEEKYNWRTLQDCADNIAALEWVIADLQRRGVTLRVVWMPLNPDPAYAQAAYWPQLRETVNAMLAKHNIDVLDLADAFESDEFHDLVHLNRETGAPLFTKEVDQWLGSFAARSS